VPASGKPLTSALSRREREKKTALSLGERVG
jgi:hypothetical protein